MAVEHGFLVYIGDGAQQYSSRLSFRTASADTVLEEHPRSSAVAIPQERVVRALDDLNHEGWDLIDAWRSKQSHWDCYLLRRDHARNDEVPVRRAAT
jgi:hypothetical protein